VSGALWCAANLSEGRDPEVIDSLRTAAGDCLADVHRDADHNRSVLTLVGRSDAVLDAVLAVAAVAVASIDLTAHHGVHPRIGAIDVVPFTGLFATQLAEAVEAREAAIRRLGLMGLSVFRFGPLPDGTTRSLPELRRGAFSSIAPDAGPRDAHPRAGAVAVGARGALVAWNAWIHGATLEATRSIAASVRSPAVRALGFEVQGATQVSCNLLEPARVTPKDVYGCIEAALPAEAHIVRCELVGLLPASTLDAVPEGWWERVDLSQDRAVEVRAASLGLTPG